MLWVYQTTEIPSYVALWNTFISCLRSNGQKPTEQMIRKKFVLASVFMKMIISYRTGRR